MAIFGDIDEFTTEQICWELLRLQGVSRSVMSQWDRLENRHCFPEFVIELLAGRFWSEEFQGRGLLHEADIRAAFLFLGHGSEIYP